MEKVVKHLSAEKGINGDKVCVGDLAVVCMFVMAVYLKNVEEFKAVAPTSMALVDHLMKEDKMKALVEDAHKTKFFPF